jgi:hypothetical protein
VGAARTAGAGRARRPIAGGTLAERAGNAAG